MGKKKNLTIIGILSLFIGVLSLALSINLVTPKNAFAGVNVDPGGGGGGGGGSYYNTAGEGPYGIYNPNIPEGGGSHSIACYLHVDPIPGNCGQGFRFNHFFAGGNPDPACIECPDVTDPVLKSEILNNNPAGVGGDHGDGQRVHGGYCGGLPLDAVGVDKQVKDASIDDYTITYTDRTDGKNVEEVFVDDSEHEKDAEWLGNHIRSSANYAYTTKLTETAIDKEFNAHIVHVRYQKTTLIDGNGSETRDGIWDIDWGTNSFYCKDPTKYVIVGGITEDNEVMKYSSDEPTSHAELYQPLNLNRGIGGPYGTATAGLALSSDISASGTDKLHGSVNNQRNLTQNEPIETLDLNNDAQFTLSFENGYPFGLPKQYNGVNNPPHGNTVVDRLTNGEYANGWNSGGDTEGPDVGWFRHSTTAGCGIHSIEGSSDSEALTSLVETDEYTGKAIQEGVSGNDFDYLLGTDIWGTKRFAARTISNGIFKLGNSQDSSYRNGWIIAGNKSRYWEYGVHYSGEVTARLTNNTYIQAPSAGPSVGDYGLPKDIITSCDISAHKTFGKQTGGTLITYGDKLHRGLYIALATHGYETPLLCGTFVAKTLAGSATR